MPAAGIVAVAIVGVLLAYRWPLSGGAGAAIAAWLLVPQTVHLPGSLNLGVARLVTVALLAGLAVQCRRGHTSFDIFRPTVVHGVLAAYLLVALLCGVALADPAVPAEQVATEWGRLVDQGLFFVALLAVARAAGIAHLAALVSAGITAAAAIAIAERLVEGTNWLGWWMSEFPLEARDLGATSLAVRGGDTRVRAAAQFALEFGWLTALLFPMTVVAVAWTRRRIALLAPAVVLLASVWTVSRSALGGLALGAGALAILALRDRRLRLLAGSGLLGLMVLLALPGVREPFVDAFQSGELTVRSERLPRILDHAAEDPVTGLGLGGLAARGFPTTDVSYVLTYAELGVLGLVALLTMWITAIAAVAGGLRLPPGRDRTIAAAALVGVALLPLAAATYDLSSTAQSTKALWTLVAIGLAASELARRTGPARSPSLPAFPARARPVLPLAGLVIGLAVTALTPARTARTLVFEALPVDQDLAVPHPNTFSGRVVVRSACAIARAADLPDGTRVDCRVLHEPGGVGELRITGSDRERVRHAETSISDAVGAALPGFRAHPRGPIREARPTAAGTAPMWLGAAGLAVALLWPWGGGQRAKRSPSSGMRRPVAAPHSPPTAYATAPAAPDS